MSDLADVKQAVEFLDGWDIDAAWVDAACAALREWLEQQEQQPSYEHRERVQQALDSFDLTLTRDENVRYLAHGAMKSLEFFDALAVPVQSPEVPT